MIFKKLDPTIPIQSIDDWFEHTPPKQKIKHWVDGRSAMETANLWLKGVPAEFEKIVEPFHLQSFEVAPEFVTHFDSHGGEGRNHDLFIRATDAEGNITAISVESKVDEAFGEKVGQYSKIIQQKLKGKIKTNAGKRIEDLYARLLSGRFPENHPDLRYQILTGIAGALAEAEKQQAVRAVFIVQTLLTESIDLKKHKSNQRDLNQFIQLFTNEEYLDIQNGQLIGPFMITWNRPMELWIGKYTVGTGRDLA